MAFTVLPYSSSQPTRVDRNNIKQKCKNHKNSDAVFDFDAKEEYVFVLAAKAFFDVDDVLPVTNKEDNGVLLKLSDWWKHSFFKHNLISRLKGQLKVKFGDILCSFADKSVSKGLRYDCYSMNRIYYYFECYYHDDAGEDSRKYLAAAIRCYSKYREITDWEFPFRSLSKFFAVEEFNWKSEYKAFVDTFVNEGGIKIMVESFKYGFYYFSDPLKLAIQMTRYPGFSQILVMTEDFMSRLKSKTNDIFKEPNAWRHYSHYLLLLLWLGLFPSNKTIRDPNGKEWGITSVTEEMRIFVDEYKNNHEPLTRGFKDGLHDLKPQEYILNAYMTSSPGVLDELTMETVKLMHDIYLRCKALQ